MQRALPWCACAGLLGVVVGCGGPPAKPPSPGPSQAPIGNLLYHVEPPAGGFPTPRAHCPKTAGNPVVVPECHLAVIDRQDVPSQHDGVLRFLVAEIRDGENVPNSEVLTVRVPKRDERLFGYTAHVGSLFAGPPALPLLVPQALDLKPQLKRYRRLREGDSVEAGQLLAVLDDRLARADWAIKQGKAVVSQWEFISAEKKRDEAEEIYLTSKKLGADGRASSREQIAKDRLTWEHYKYEALSKREAMVLARLEVHQADTVLEMHEMYSAISGTVKTLYKRTGEAVKSQEPVLQLVGLDRLRAEGYVDAKHWPRLRKGLKAVVEHARDEGPMAVRSGHRGEITGVAVSVDPRHPLIASASADGTVRVWDRTTPGERWCWEHPAAVWAVACAPSGAGERANLCLTGAADGKARLWDLQSGKRVRELAEAHPGGVTCVAFSPDGRWCATGGRDRAIRLSNTATGELLYRFPAGHGSAPTSLCFTPHAQLVSAAEDKTMYLWTLGEKAARREDVNLNRRSGAVTQLGTSPDGKLVLFDQGKTLRLLSLPEGQNRGELVHPAAAASFTGFALFSPNAQLILTATAPDGRAQLWSVPTETTRGSPVRQLVSEDRSPVTCAAFAPDGSFAVTGTKDQKVLLWPVPTEREMNERITAELTLVEPSIDGSAGQVRLWAEMPNPGRRLLPGASVTLVIPPEE
jgi:WD40 repeat protein